MNRTLILLATGAAWAFMMAELVKREVLPYWEYQAPPTYRSYFLSNDEPRLQRWSLWMGGRTRIGASETVSGPAGLRVPHYRLRTHTTYDMTSSLPAGFSRLPGLKFEFESWNEMTVDSSYQLAEFTLNIRSAVIRGFAKGERLGSALRIKHDIGPFKGEQSIEFPRDAILSDAAMPFHGGGRLYVNKKWKMTTVEPDFQAGLKVVHYFALVESKETREWDGKPVTVFRVDIKRRPVDAVPVYQVYVTEAGKILEQYLSMGKFMIRCALEEDRILKTAEAAAWPWSPEKGD